MAALLDQDNIDTDQVLPSGVYARRGSGLCGRAVFALWRRDPAFVLSRPGWRSAGILVSGANFGCGSTREHAVWALDAFGIRVLIAASFGEVFRDNCVKNGILPIIAAAEPLTRLRADIARSGGAGSSASGSEVAAGDRAGVRDGVFELPGADKTALLEGLDEIGMTLQQADAISAWEQVGSSQRGRGARPSGPRNERRPAPSRRPPAQLASNSRR